MALFEGFSRLHFKGGRPESNRQVRFRGGNRKALPLSYGRRGVFILSFQSIASCSVGFNVVVSSYNPIIKKIFANVKIIFIIFKNIFIMKKFNEIVENLMVLKKLRSEAELARMLGLSSQAYNDRKMRGSVPVEKIIDFCERENVSLDWLLLGREPEKPAAPESDIERRIAELEKIIKKK